MPSPRLKRISRRSKLIAYFLIDLALVPASLFVATALRYGSFTPNLLIDGEASLFIGLTLCAAVVLLGLRLPWIKLSAFEGRAVVRIAAGAGSLAVCAMALSYMLGFSGARSVPMIFGAIFFISALGARFLLLLTLGTMRDSRVPRRPGPYLGRRLRF